MMIKGIGIRDRRNGERLWIHKCVIECWAKIIKPEGVAVYCLLANSDFSKDHPGIVYPSQKEMARKLGWARSRVNRWLKVLTQNRLISIDRRKRHYLVYVLNKVKCLNSPNGIHRGAVSDVSSADVSSAGCSASKTEMSHQRNPDVAPADTNKNKEKEEIKNNINFLNFEKDGKDINQRKRILEGMRKDLSEKLWWKQ